MGNEIVQLDLEKVDLFGWQGRVYKPKIESIIRGIEVGDKIKPVSVYRINDSVYQLTKEIKEPKKNTSLGLDGQPIFPGFDGGHHRSYAHFESGKPLVCIVKGEQEDIDFGECQMKEINVRDLYVEESNRGTKLFEKTKKQDSVFR